MAWRDDFIPLHVRAWLRSPVIADRWLPLDGVLFYQACRERCGPQIVTTPGTYAVELESIRLPMAIEHPGQQNWYYRCSWARWSHEIEGTDHWSKHFNSALADLIDFGKRRGKVIIEQGRYKAYFMPVFYRAALWVEWYCVGDKTEIEYLLSTVTHIGKKGVQGWGRVMHWEIVPCEADWSIWRDGRLMRGVPYEDLTPGIMVNFANYGIRPSYWRRENQMMLAVPK